MFRGSNAFEASTNSIPTSESSEVKGKPELQRKSTKKQKAEKGEKTEYEYKNRELLLKLIDTHNKARPELSDDKILNRECIIKEKTSSESEIKRFLEKLGIEEIEFKEVGEDLYEIRLNRESVPSDIPEGYALTGGAARIILQQELGVDYSAKPRDIDLARITSTKTPDDDRVLAKLLSPDDFENQTSNDKYSGVEELDMQYFKKRDFTINEVLVAGDRLYATKNCLMDTARGIIRFSEHEKQELWDKAIGIDEEDYYDADGNFDEETYLVDREEARAGGYFVKSKLLAKAIRLAAEAASRGKKLAIADEYPFQHQYMKAFHIALHLDKALGQGRDVALRYIQQLQGGGELEEDTSPGEVMIEFIRKMESDGSFIFQHAPSSVFVCEAEFLDEHISQKGGKQQSEKRLASEVNYGKYADSFDKEVRENGVDSKTKLS